MVVDIRIHHGSYVYPLFWSHIRNIATVSCTAKNDVGIHSGYALSRWLQPMFQAFRCPVEGLMFLKKSVDGSMRLLLRRLRWLLACWLAGAWQPSTSTHFPNGSFQGSGVLNVDPNTDARVPYSKDRKRGPNFWKLPNGSHAIHRRHCV